MGFLKDLFGGGFDDDPAGGVISLASGELIPALFGEDTANLVGDPLDLFGNREAAAGEEASKQAQSELERAIQLAIDEQRRAGGEAQGFLAPFGGVGLQGVEQASFLTDPQKQFEFLQNNPLFKLALENANQNTLSSKASGGRLSAGDTLTQLSNNTLLSAAPLIDRQSQGIGDLLNFGSGIARSQANTALGVGSDVSGLIQSRGNVGAEGIFGRNQIQADKTAGQQELAGTILSVVASDPRLKENTKIVGEQNGYKIWTWDWNELANKVFGLTGSSRGVMVPEVLEKDPEAVVFENGYGKVNYSMIGVTHG